MFHYKCCVSYDGSRYNGWQKQNNTHNTIQEVIENTIGSLYSPVSIRAAGRTDAGVHALCQVFDFYIEKKIDFEQFIINMNEMLPNDIRILQIDSVSKAFHSRKSAISKTYMYQFDLREVPQVFIRKYAYHIDNAQNLSIEAICSAANHLCGSHDFSAFTNDKRASINKVRRIDSIEIIVENDLLKMYYTGEGFLYNMVRILTGTLLEVGLGQRTPESLITLLNSKDRSQAGFLMPANGLFLVDIKY